MRDRRWAASLAARSVEREQNTYAQMCGLQFGFVAAQSLGLLQAAERGSRGGGLYFCVFRSIGIGSCDRLPEYGLDDRMVVDWARTIAGYGSYDLLHPAQHQFSEKTPFFNGLLGI